jgi:hypothetical protein
MASMLTTPRMAPEAARPRVPGLVVPRVTTPRPPRIPGDRANPKNPYVASKALVAATGAQDKAPALLPTPQVAKLSADGGVLSPRVLAVLGRLLAQ